MSEAFQIPNAVIQIVNMVPMGCQISSNDKSEKNRFQNISPGIYMSSLTTLGFINTY